jgi:hypothetical protein
VEFGAERKEFIGQPRLTPTEKVLQVSLDSMQLAEVRLMKIDVEGMEEAALQGAQATIGRDRPLCLVEWIKSDKAALVQFFKTRDYTVCAYGMSLLCVPAPGAFPLKHNLAEL